MPPQKLGPQREPAQSKCISSQEPLYTEIYRKNAAPQLEPRTRTHTLREPAWSKRMSTFHKSHFLQKFTAKKARDQSEHPDQAPAFTASVRTPQCGHTVWGIKLLSTPSTVRGWTRAPPASQHPTLKKIASVTPCSHRSCPKVSWTLLKWPFKILSMFQS